jgi:cold shock CspA family protein
MSVVIGQVVWFDRKKGFGFVKVVDPDSELFDKELFIHYSSIQCDSSFKFVFPGETVSLNAEKNTEQSEGQKEYLTSNVRGVFGSKLMIDNERYMFKVIRKTNREEEEPVEEDGDADDAGDADEQ